MSPPTLSLLTILFFCFTSCVITSTGSAPLSEASAKAIFETEQYRSHLDIIPNLVEIASAPSPPHSSKTKTRLHPIKVPQGIKSNFSSPGIPSNAPIAVGVNKSLPLIHTNSENLANSSSDTNTNPKERRQGCAFANCCPFPRYHNQNTAYPWSATGQWQWAGGVCSGTLVGPKHVLTSSSCVDWATSPQTGTYTTNHYFSPQYWLHHVTTYTVATIVYYGDHSFFGPPTTYDQQAFDYVIAILEEIPNVGWLGSKTYDYHWDGLTAWYTSGYGFQNNEPYAQNNFKVNEVAPKDYGGELLEYTMCAYPDDNGSGVFGWFSDGPYLIGTEDTANSLGVVGPAGATMVDLINVARQEYPYP